MNSNLGDTSDDDRSSQRTITRSPTIRADIERDTKNDVGVHIGYVSPTDDEIGYVTPIKKKQVVGRVISKRKRHLSDSTFSDDGGNDDEEYLPITKHRRVQKDKKAERIVMSSSSGKKTTPSVIPKWKKYLTDSSISNDEGKDDEADLLITKDKGVQKGKKGERFGTTSSSGKELHSKRSKKKKI